MEEETAFQQLKTLLIEAPVLTYPDPSWQYILDTDASNEAAGAVLSQMVEGEEHVVAYYSKTFSPPAAELLCDQTRTIGSGFGNQPFPAISLWARVPAADGSRFTVMAV